MNIQDVDRECPIFNSTLGNARRGPLNLPLNVCPYRYLSVPFLMIYQCGVSVLSRVQAFLPQMEASNVILTERAEADPQSVDMEQVGDEAEPYIEMVRLHLFNARAVSD